MQATLDTFPRLMLEHARVRPSHPATREKDLGIWQTWTWRQVAAEVRALACGLAAQGFQRGMHLAIIGDNRPRLYWSMLAAQSLGGVPVPMYQDAPAAEFVYVLNDAEIAYAIVEDQEQVDKVLEAKPQVPHAARMSTTTIRAACAATRRRQHRCAAGARARVRSREPGLLRGRGREGPARRRLDHALHVGNDRQAEGRAQTHRAFIAAAAGGSEFDRLGPTTACFRTCRWPGSAITCSRSRSGSTPASRSTAPSRATP